jgi:hypothetical protein
MRRTILSIFAAAALLPLAAGGSAMAKMDAPPMPAGELRSGPLARIADAIEPTPVERRIRVAPIYMKIPEIKGEVTNNKQGKKGLRTSPQGGGAKGKQAPWRPS